MGSSPTESIDLQSIELYMKSDSEKLNDLLSFLRLEYNAGKITREQYSKIMHIITE